MSKLLKMVNLELKLLYSEQLVLPELI